MAFNPRYGYNFDDLRSLAKTKLPKGLFEFIDRGTEDDLTIRNNHESFRQVRLIPRPLVNVSNRTQSITLFGRQQPLPFCLAPTGAAGLLWYDGEIETAAAAASAGIPYVMSTGSIVSIEKVAEKAGGDLWFQLYLWPDISMSLELVRRAKAANYRVLVVTIDTTVTPNREFNYRNGFTIPIRLTRRSIIDGARHWRWTTGVMGRYLLNGGMPRFSNLPSALQQSMTDTRKTGLMPKNDSLTWQDLRRLRDIWDGPLVVKGILHPEDAHEAVAAGADGIVVSNHGGRVLDNAPASLQMLPGVREAVDERTTVFLDSGIRRGSDIVKALAVGADAVMVGRAAMWGTAVGGRDGAAHAIAMLRDEVDRVMAFIGCNSPEALSTACCASLP